jgi:hypothetical protein
VIFVCETILAMGLVAAKPIRKEYLNIASIASKSLCYSDEPKWDSVTSGVFDPGLVTAPTIYEQIDAVCEDAESYEPGEERTAPIAISSLKALLYEAEQILGREIALGDIAPYFGELSITWRHDNRMLRLTSFSDERHSRLDFGSAPANALGNYDFDAAVTGGKLADKLSWLRNWRQVGGVRPAYES